MKRQLRGKKNPLQKKSKQTSKRTPNIPRTISIFNNDMHTHTRVSLASDDDIQERFAQFIGPNTDRCREGTINHVRGLVATKPINPGDVIVSIPSKLAFTEYLARNSVVGKCVEYILTNPQDTGATPQQKQCSVSLFRDIFKDSDGRPIITHGHLHLFVFLVYHRFISRDVVTTDTTKELETWQPDLESSSNHQIQIDSEGPLTIWSAYAQWLPSVYSLPLCWSTQQLSVIQGTDLYRAVANRRQQLYLIYTEVFTRLFHIFPQIFSKDVFTYERFIWAFCAYASRSFPAKLLMTSDICTSLQSMNYSSLYCHSDTIPDWFSLCGVMLPFLDLTNHKINHPIHWVCGHFSVTDGFDNTSISPPSVSSASHPNPLQIGSALITYRGNCTLLRQELSNDSSLLTTVDALLIQEEQLPHGPGSHPTLLSANYYNTASPMVESLSKSGKLRSDSDQTPQDGMHHSLQSFADLNANGTPVGSTMAYQSCVSYAPGDEIYNNYGPKGNNELLFGYGFVQGEVVPAAIPLHSDDKTSSTASSSCTFVHNPFNEVVVQVALNPRDNGAGISNTTSAEQRILDLCMPNQRAFHLTKHGLPKGLSTTTALLGFTNVDCEWVSSYLIPILQHYIASPSSSSPSNSSSLLQFFTAQLPRHVILKGLYRLFRMLMDKTLGIPQTSPQDIPILQSRSDADSNGVGDLQTPPSADITQGLDKTLCEYILHYYPSLLKELSARYDHELCLAHAISCVLSEQGAYEYYCGVIYKMDHIYLLTIAMNHTIELFHLLFSRIVIPSQLSLKASPPSSSAEKQQSTIDPMSLYWADTCHFINVKTNASGDDSIYYALRYSTHWHLPRLETSPHSEDHRQPLLRIPIKYCLGLPPVLDPQDVYLRPQPSGDAQQLPFMTPRQAANAIGICVQGLLKQRDKYIEFALFLLHIRFYWYRMIRDKCTPRDIDGTHEVLRTTFSSWDETDVLTALLWSTFFETIDNAENHPYNNWIRHSPQSTALFNHYIVTQRKSAAPFTCVVKPDSSVHQHQQPQDADVGPVCAVLDWTGSASSSFNFQSLADIDNNEYDYNDIYSPHDLDTSSSPHEDSDDDVPPYMACSWQHVTPAHTRYTSEQTIVDQLGDVLKRCIQLNVVPPHTELSDLHFTLHLAYCLMAGTGDHTRLIPIQWPLHLAPSQAIDGVWPVDSLDEPACLAIASLQSTHYGIDLPLTSQHNQGLCQQQTKVYCLLESPTESFDLAVCAGRDYDVYDIASITFDSTLIDHHLEARGGGDESVGPDTVVSVNTRLQKTTTSDSFSLSLLKWYEAYSQSIQQTQVGQDSNQNLSKTDLHTINFPLVRVDPDEMVLSARRINTPDDMVTRFDTFALENMLTALCDQQNGSESSSMTNYITCKWIDGRPTQDGQVVHEVSIPFIPTPTLTISMDWFLITALTAPSGVIPLAIKQWREGYQLSTILHHLSHKINIPFLSLPTALPHITLFYCDSSSAQTPAQVALPPVLSKSIRIPLLPLPLIHVLLLLLSMGLSSTSDDDDIDISFGDSDSDDDTTGETSCNDDSTTQADQTLVAQQLNPGVHQMQTTLISQLCQFSQHLQWSCDMGGEDSMILPPPPPSSSSTQIGHPIAQLPWIVRVQVLESIRWAPLISHVLTCFLNQHQVRLQLYSQEMKSVISFANIIKQFRDSALYHSFNISNAVQILAHLEFLKPFTSNISK